MIRVATTCAVLLASFTLLPPGCARQEHSAVEGPNVLLIIVDTLRADHLGSYGPKAGPTPEIDRLAAGSVVFDRAIASSTTTVPSHAAIMTSMHIREVASGFATGEGRLESSETLAATFRSAGYVTGAFVGNYVLKRRWGFARGFDVFDDELPGKEMNRVAPERIAEDTTRRAIAWMESADHPFFLWVHYQDPHGPYLPPPPERGKVYFPPAPGEKALKLPKGRTDVSGIPAYQVVPGLTRPSAYRSAYGDEILYADRWIGELLAAFDTNAAGRDTVVMLTSDHGESFGEDGRYFAHGFATTPQLAHVPLLLRAPGLRPGRRADFVSHVDIMPTLLDLAGIEVGEGLRGLPLGRFLRQERALPERYVYCDIGREFAAYRGHGFVRATGIAGYVETARERRDLKERPEVRWQRYDWTPGETWTLIAEDVEPEEELRDYMRSGVPLRQLELDSDTKEKLRSMGYLSD